MLNKCYTAYPTIHSCVTYSVAIYRLYSFTVEILKRMYDSVCFEKDYAAAFLHTARSLLSLSKLTLKNNL